MVIRRCSEEGEWTMVTILTAQRRLLVVGKLGSQHGNGCLWSVVGEAFSVVLGGSARRCGGQHLVGVFEGGSNVN